MGGDILSGRNLSGTHQGTWSGCFESKIKHVPPER